MKRYIDLDLEKCSACGACAVACMDQNDIDIQTEIPFRHVFMAGKNGIHGKEPIYASLACMHCSDAPCVISCPVGCLSKDGDTGFTLYDNTNCIGCHSCAMACPFGVPSFNRMGKMQKCDGCIERQLHGMEPACTRVCPTGALKCYTEEEYETARIEKSVKKVLDAL